MIIELDKEATNIKLLNVFGKVTLTFDSPNRLGCIYVTKETEECEIESINENLVTLKYKNHV